MVAAHAAGCPVTPAHLCAAVIEAVGVDGVVVATTLSGRPRETLYATDPLAAAIEELSVRLGQGPGIEAVAGGPVLAGDLGSPVREARWPLFTPAARAAGAGACFALPLRVGGLRLGAMVLHRVHPGELDRGQIANALILAERACALVLDDAAEAVGRWPGIHTGPDAG
jgi:hypothetical protein